MKAEIKKLDYTKENRNGRERPTMHLLARDAEGNRIHLKNKEADPYFCVPSSDVTRDLMNNSRVDRIEEGYTSIRGKKLTRIYTYIPGDVPQVREGFDHYEADILFPNRFSLDTGIYRGVEIGETEGEIDLDDIEKAEFSVETRILYCDIEVDDKNGFPDETKGEEEIVCLTFYDNFEKEYHCYLYHTDISEVNPETRFVDDVNIEVFETESEMLRSFAEFLKEKEPDVMAGWNFREFDATYLISRFEYLSDLDKNELSPLGTAYKDEVYGRTVGKIKGISVFDMLDAYKNLEFTELDSFSLDDVAQNELDIGKLEKGEQKIYEMYEDNLNILLEYNIRDVYLTVMLEEERDIISFYEEVCNFVGGRLTEVVDYSKAADIYVLRTVNGRFVLPSSRTIEGGDEEFEGATVFDPASEIKDMVSVLDLASLYPMSLKTLNAGPRTKDPDGEITAPNGVSYTTENDSIVKQMIDDLLDERVLLKEKRDSQQPRSAQYHKYDMQQRAVKVIMNCFSGDTEVVTPDGVRNIKDIEVGDEVYSINPETHNVEIKEVIDTTVQENQYGRLEHIDTQLTDLKITPNHRMFVSCDHDDEIHDGSFIEHYNYLNSGYTYTIPTHNKIEGEQIENIDIGIASDEGRIWIDSEEHGRVFRNSLTNELGNALVYKRPRAEFLLEDLELYEKYRDEIHKKASKVEIQYGKNHSSIPTTFDFKDWMKFIGWIISEGSFNHVEEKGNDGSGSYRGESKMISIAQKDSYNRSRITRLLERMGINYSKSSSAIGVSNSVLYDIIIDEVGEGSYNKKIPDYVFNMNIDGSVLMHLLDTLVRGDGDKTGENSYRYSTASDQLKEDVVKLAVECGFKPRVSSDSGVWRINISKNNGSFKKSRTETEDHDGKVYCITVEDNYTVLAGRNGKFQWTGNTLYGLMGWDRFRLYDQDNASAVTAVGREVINFTQEKVEELGYDVIYGDTDSVMVGFENIDSINTVIEISYEMEEIINDAYDQFAEDMLDVDEHFFEIEFEKLYRKFIQAGKKKRYAGHIVWKEGKQVDDIDIVGFEFQRSDYSNVARNLQQRLIEKILMGAGKQEVSDMIRDEIGKIKNMDHDLDELGIAGGIGREFDEYTNKTKHVRGSEYANKHFGEQIQPGDKPNGIYVKRVGGDYPRPPQLKDSAFICWLNSANVPDSIVVDFEKYLDIQIHGPLSRIIECTEWRWDEIESGHNQTSVIDFDGSSDVDDIFGGEMRTSSKTVNANNDKTKQMDTQDNNDVSTISVSKIKDMKIDDSVKKDDNSNENKEQDDNSTQAQSSLGAFGEE